MKETFKKICIQCNNEFDCHTGHPNTKTCSKKCLSDYKKSDEYKNNTKKSGRKKIIRTNICIQCNKEFNPGRHKENKMCSKECRSKHRATKEVQDKMAEKTKETCLEKYGVEYISQRNGHKESVIETWKNKPIEEKKDISNRRVKTHNSKSNEEKQKIKNKRAKTKIERYDHPAFNNNKKAQKTNLKKFGSPYYLGSKESINLRKNQALEIIETLFNSNDLKLIDKYIGKSNKENNKKIYYTIECLKCNNIFKSTIDFNKIDDNTQEDGSLTICRKCYPLHTNTKLQKEFTSFLDSINIKYEESVRNLIQPFELDVYIPNNNLAIELNGNYWHSVLGGGKNMTYHLNKTKLCNKKGIKLIHIFEDEWLFKKDIVKSMILNNLGLIKNKIYARNCIIKEISSKEKNKFINENHIQGDGPDKIRLGLFNNNELLSVITFSKENRSKKNKDNNKWELSRFCSKKYHVIPGSFSKLLSYFIKTYNPKQIITFADIRWSGLNIENTVYLKNKFNFSYNTKPNYWYVDSKEYLKRTHRFANRKSELIKKFGEEFKNNTEWEIAKSNDMDKIWDCGSMRFELNL